MLLKQSSPEIDRSHVGEELSFGIAAENMGLVLGILRSKLYSDPIAAICREVACNARDANREAGKGNVPIRVQFPSRFDPHLKISDDGLGISPERIRTIFVNFGASTKRSDNVQTGGFGLGAKTPFAYADQFTITTTHRGIRRIYTAFLDETQRGSLALLSETSTDESSGTTIAIPIRQGDAEKFVERMTTATRYWPVKPTGVPHPSAPTPVMSGDGWYVIASNNSEIVITIDGIAFAVDPSAIDLPDRWSLKNDDPLRCLLGYASRRTIVEFPNGDLPISANRESIHWTEDAKRIVRDQVKAIAAEIVSRVAAEITACPTWIDACIKSTQLRSAFELSGASVETWRDLTLHSGVYLSGGMTYRPGSWIKEKRSRYVPCWTSLFLVNDTPLKTLSLSHIKAIWRDLPFNIYTNVHVVSEVPPELRGLVPHVNASDLLAVKPAKPAKPARRLFRYTGSRWVLSNAKEWDSAKGQRVWVGLVRRSYPDRLEHAINSSVIRAIDAEAELFGFPDGEADYAEYKSEAMSIDDYVSKCAAKFDLQDLANAEQSAMSSYSALAEEYPAVLPGYLAHLEVIRSKREDFRVLSAMGVSMPSPNGITAEHRLIDTAIAAMLKKYPLAKYSKGYETDSGWKDYLK